MNVTEAKGTGIHTSVPTACQLTRQPGTGTKTQTKTWATEFVVVVTVITPGMEGTQHLKYFAVWIRKPLWLQSVQTKPLQLQALPPKSREDPLPLKEPQPAVPLAQSTDAMPPTHTSGIMINRWRLTSARTATASVKETAATLTSNLAKTRREQRRYQEPKSSWRSMSLPWEVLLRALHHPLMFEYRRSPTSSMSRSPSRQHIFCFHSGLRSP